MMRLLLQGAGAVLIACGLLLSAYPLYSPWLYGVVQQRLAADYQPWREPELPQTDVVPGSVGADPRGKRGVGFNPGAPLGRIRIEKVGLEAFVVEGVSARELSKGPGRVPGTALPGESGNLVIAGHRTTFGAPFGHVDQLVPGDIIAVQYGGTWHEYRVEDSFTVLPHEVWVMNGTDQAILTLITCHPPYSAAERLIVRAHLK